MDINEENGLLFETNLKQLGIKTLFLYVHFVGNSYVFYFNYDYSENKNRQSLKKAVKEIAKFHQRDIYLDESLYSDFRIINRIKKDNNNPPLQEDVFTQFAIETAKRGVRLIKQASSYEFDYHYCLPYYSGYRTAEQAFDAALRLHSGMRIDFKYQRDDSTGYLCLSYDTSSSIIATGDINNMSGKEFEDHLLRVFSRQGITAEKTKETGDQGVDLIVKTNDGNIAIQCKRYKEVVGNSAVQEVTAGMRFYKLNGGIVVTNSYFSKPAIDLANACDVLLVDQRKISDFLSNPRKYLNAALKLTSIN